MIHTEIDTRPATVEVVAAPVGPTPLVARVVARYNMGGGLDADALGAVRRRRSVLGRSAWAR